MNILCVTTILNNNRASYGCSAKAGFFCETHCMIWIWLQFCMNHAMHCFNCHRSQWSSDNMPNCGTWDSRIESHSKQFVCLSQNHWDSLGHGLCTLTAVPRPTQPSTLLGMIKWVLAFTVECRRPRNTNLLAWSEGQQLLFLRCPTFIRWTKWTFAITAIPLYWVLALLTLSEDCQLLTDIGCRSLRSADVLTCATKRTRTRLGDRSFSVAGPCLGNSLPVALRDRDISLVQFEIFEDTLVWVGLWRIVTFLFFAVYKYFYLLTYLFTYYLLLL